MIDSLLNNCYLLGALSGLLTVLIFFVYNKYSDNNEKDENIYIKIFIMSSIITCLAVYISQNTNVMSSIQVQNKNLDIHTGSPSF